MLLTALINQMMRLNNRLFLLVLTVLYLPFANGQEASSFRENITDKLLKYCETYPWEDIFVHTDRANYIAGEEIWFSTYLVDRQSNKPSGRSRIAYIELLNSDNRPVIQKRILLNNGYGPGQFSLPDTLSTGNYLLRAYTNLMKNHDPSAFFYYNINIYNAIRNKPLSWDAPQDSYLEKHSEDLKSTVISNPEISLMIAHLKSDSLRLSIFSDENYRSSNNNTCYLVIQTHGKINIIRSIELHSEATNIEIHKGLLTPGINHFALFDLREQFSTEGFSYTPNNDDHFVFLDSEDSCKVRDCVSIDMECKDGLVTNSEKANFSISVIQKTESANIYDLDDYMVFGTEFGILPDIARNCKPDELSPSVMDSLLRTLKSNWIDWNRIMSGQWPEGNYKAESKEHFLKGNLTYGTPVAGNNEKYLFLSSPGKEAVFSYAKTDNEGNFVFPIQVQEEIVDLIIQPEEVEGKPIIKIESPYSEEYLPSEKWPGESDEVTPSLSMYSVNYQINKIYGLTSAGDHLSPAVPVQKPLRFYGRPDIELFMDDYIKLPVMEEVFFELIRGVSLKKKKSGYVMTVAGKASNSVYEKPPIMFIDGVVVNDPSVIAGVNPEIVEKIDAVTELYQVGDYLFFGIVNIITYAGNFRSVTLPDYAVRLKYRVVDPVMQFSSPSYSSDINKQSRIPDYRNTLYWNPSVQTGPEGKTGVKFYTSDIPGEYVINLQGFTPAGNMVSLRKTFVVR